MPYCPKCESEYAEGIKECIECRVRLRPGHRPVHVGLDFEDILVPGALLICLIVATSLLAVWFLARMGQIPDPLGAMIVSAQPTCLIPIYAIGAIFSAGLLAVWLIRRLLRAD